MFKIHKFLKGRVHVFTFLRSPIFGPLILILNTHTEDFIHFKGKKMEQAGKSQNKRELRNNITIPMYKVYFHTKSTSKL